MSSSQEVGEIFGSGTGPATALLRSPTVIIASIGLWGMNVYLFRLFGIDYRRVLLLDLVKEREAKEKAAAARRGRRGGGGGTGKRRVSGSEPNIGSTGAVGGGSGGGGGGGGGNRREEYGMRNEEVPMDKLEKRSDAGGHDGDVELASLIAEESSGGGGGGGGAAAVDMEIPPSPVDMEIPPSPGDGGVKSRAVAAAKHPVTPHSAAGSLEIPSTPSKSTSSSAAATVGSASVSVATRSALLESGVPNCDITAFNLLSLSLFLLLALHASSYLYIHVFGGSTVGAIFAFYAVALVGIALPLPRTRWMRVAARTVMCRAAELLNPRCACLTGDRPRPIPFLDVFFADAMCSLSKVFFDWGMLWHLASHYPDAVPPSFHAIVIPSLCASLPYVIRARQCLVMHEVGRLKGDPKRYQHVLNAIKYSTSLFPLIVSASQKTDVGERHREVLERLLVVLMVVNSSYSFIWDVVMDWGMMDNPRVVLEQTLTPCSSTSELPGVADSGADSRQQQHHHHYHHPLDTHVSHHCSRAFLRPRLRFGPTTSVGILVADAVLRFFWVVRFYAYLIFPSNDAYVLCTEFLEVFRRAIWNLLRVEWENIKQGRAVAVMAAGAAVGERNGLGLMVVPRLGHGVGNGTVSAAAEGKGEEGLPLTADSASVTSAAPAGIKPMNRILSHP